MKLVIILIVILFIIAAFALLLSYHMLLDIKEQSKEIARLHSRIKSLESEFHSRNFDSTDDLK